MHEKRRVKMGRVLVNSDWEGMQRILTKHSEVIFASLILTLKAFLPRISSMRFEYEHNENIRGSFGMCRRKGRMRTTL